MIGSKELPSIDTLRHEFLKVGVDVSDLTDVQVEVTWVTSLDIARKLTAKYASMLPRATK